MNFLHLYKFEYTITMSIYLKAAQFYLVGSGFSGGIYGTITCLDYMLDNRVPLQVAIPFTALVAAPLGALTGPILTPWVWGKTFHDIKHRKESSR